MTSIGTTPPEIHRNHLVRTLVKLLAGETQTVVLEGTEGIGKTTLLRQFHSANAGRTFALFLSAASKWAYDDFQMGLELASQMSQRLRGRELFDDEISDRRIYGRFITELDRMGRREAQPFYLILDGLEDIPREDESTKRQLLELLPFGYSGLRFLLSGDLNKIPLADEARHRAKSWQLVFFTREESDRYLQGFQFSEEQFQKVYDATQGIPGYLASVRRRLSAGAAPDQVIDALPDAMQDSFALEWRVVPRLSDSVKLALAVLAYETENHTSSSLARILRKEPDSILSELRNLQFIRISSGNTVQFISEAFRRFAAEELIDYRQKVNDLFIDFLAEDPESDAALLQLSTALSKAEKFAEVLEYLSPDRFARLYQRTTSLKVVQQKAFEGIEAARTLKRDGDLVRFTMQKSAIDEIASSDVGVAEVKAISALGDFEGALGVANSVPRIELRFRLLAAIGRIRREQGLPEDGDLTAQIRALYAQVDPATLGDILPTAASDLFATAPDLATDLVGKMTGGRGENSIDWALASLSIQALASEHDANSRERAKELTSRIQHPIARKLSLEAGIVLGKLSAEDVIQEADRLESTGDKLYILQRWMWSNRERKDALEVLEHGIKLALQATSYSANAKVFRDLALCLPYVEDLQATSYYIGILDAQRAGLERVGPPEDFIRLQLILARSEWRHDRLAARPRLREIYNAITRIGDLVVRTACMSRFLATLKRTDKDQDLEQEDGLHSLVEAEVEEGVDDILKLSAEHHEASRSIVQALAVACPQTAVDIIVRVNTEYRRDLAYADLVESAVAGPFREVEVSFVERAVERIVDPEVRDGAIRDIVDALRMRPLTASEFEHLSPLLPLVDSIYSSSERVLSTAQLIGVLVPLSSEAKTPIPGLADLIDTLTSTLTSSWKAIDQDWEKLDLGFEVIVALAKGAPILASTFVDDVNALKLLLTIPDSATALAATMALRLAIRAFAGLAAKSIDAETNRERLVAAILRVGSITPQAQLFGEFAIRLYLAGRAAECEDIVQGHLVPLIYSIASDEEDRRTAVIVDSSPALFVGATGTALNLISSLSETSKGEALGRVAIFLLRRASPWDAYEERPGAGYNIDFETANKILQVLELMSEDWRLYSLVKSVVASAMDSVYSSNFKRAQRADLARQLTDLVRRKFPSPRFIKHNGYLIACEAHINRIREASDAIPITRLAEDARAIPNVTDRAYVLVVIASSARHARDRNLYLSEARQVADSIPMLADRLDLYYTMSSTMVDVDEQKSKDLLKAAVELSFKGEGKSIEERRRSLIELACRVHPDIAGSLASLADDDPAKSHIERQLRVYDIKNALVRRKPHAQAPVVRDIFEWSRACWLNLGSLVAGRSAPTNPKRSLGLLEHAANQPISRSYPILAWFVENAVRFHRGTEAARTYIVPLFDACLLGAELAVRASARAAAYVRPLAVIPEHRPSDGLVSGGEREEGLSLIREWIEASCPKQLYIVEPYFVPASVEALALIVDSCEDCEAVILCGRRESLGGDKSAPEEIYRQAWRRIRSDEPPPTTIILLQGKSTEKFPIHDRWWLAETGGLGLGTSYSGIGARLSEIRRLSQEEAAARLGDLLPYFTLTRKEFEGERLEYTSCSL